MNHYKYLKLLSSAILVGGISAVAAESAKPFSNFYVGVGTGYSIFNGRSVSVADTTSNKKQIHSQGFLGKIFGGYEVLSSSNIYGAVEGYFLFDPQKATYESGTAPALDQEKFSRKAAFGARGKLGTSFNETVVVYGILGVETSQFTLESTSDGFPKTVKRKFLWAAVPGAGLTIALSAKTKLGIEYTYARYQMFNTTWANRTINSSFKVRPSVNTISVGVSWSL